MTIDEKFSNALGHISTLAPQYMNFYGLFAKRATTDKDVTIRVNMTDDVHALLEYNEEFIHKISATTLAVLICNELNRILLHHCTKRRMPDAKLNFKASNVVCCDPSNNICFKLDADTAALANDMPNDTNPKILQDLPPNYNHDTDCVLEILYQMFQQKQNQQGKGKGNGNGGGQSQGNGKGKGNGGSGSGESDQTKQEREALNQHFSPENADKSTEKWGENDLADAEITKRVNETDASSWGNMPGNLRERIQAANKRVIDPRKALKDFIASAYSNNMLDTRMKPSRRMPDLIGKVPGKRHTQEFKIGVFCDASGSMGAEDLKLCVDCINDFIRSGAIVEYGWWDTHCEKPHKQVRKMADSDALGGGGTDPQCILEMIKENKLKYDGIIVITDCGFYWEKPKEYKKVFIIRVPSACDAPEWVGKRQMSVDAVRDYDARYSH